MRHFRYYFDDTLHERTQHRSGELVGRKPLIILFLRQRPRAYKGAIGASTRMGQLFVEKLKRMGL